MAQIIQDPMFREMVTSLLIMAVIWLWWGWAAKPDTYLESTTTSEEYNNVKLHDERRAEGREDKS